MAHATSGKVLSIKVLLSNTLAGSLIGLGGKSIKDLMEVSGAKVHVSNNTEPYPGTSDRVVVIAGDLDAVNLALKLIWEMIGHITCAQNPKEADWNPKEMINELGQNEEASVTGKIAIPAAAAGSILGKGGSNIQAISEQSGANVGMSSKDEAIFTQERIMTITGTLASCVKASTLILNKLNEPADPVPFVNKGTTYTATHMQTPAFGMPFGGVFGGFVPPGAYGSPANSGRREGRAGRKEQPGQAGENDRNVAAEVETTITFTVPDELVGNILGKQVSDGMG